MFKFLVTAIALFVGVAFAAEPVAKPLKAPVSAAAEGSATKTLPKAKKVKKAKKAKKVAAKAAK
jgi:hypothetical protein